MSESAPKASKWLSPWRVLLPVLLGLGAVAYVITTAYDDTTLSGIPWARLAPLWILAGVLCLFIRDASYAYRLRLLAGKQISFGRALWSIYLWEFGSAATPSSAGGMPLALVALTRSGLPPGRSLSVVFLAVTIDNLFFIFALPIATLIFGQSGLLPQSIADLWPGMSAVRMGLWWWCWLGWGLVVTYNSILAYGLLVNPLGLKRLIYRLFRLPVLSRWQRSAVRAGNDVLVAAHEIRGQSPGFWIRALLSTFVAWSARLTIAFMVLTALGAAVDYGWAYARQVVLFIITTISPTPGGSGIAELAFSAFLADWVPAGGEAAGILLWRLLSYYPYLVIGVILLPRLAKRKPKTTR